jgi:enoyl-CoA hydratase
MAERVRYELGDDGVATVTMDDGKVNALSRAMLGEIREAFEKAAADGAAVLLTGRPAIFSGGFDLATLRGGNVAEAMAMVRAGFELAERVLSFPRPVVVASGGHAIAMGTFLLLSGDLRIGSSAPARYSANEVAIGLSVPAAALAILRYRLTPSAADRAAVTAAVFDPQQAVAAGFLHEVVEPDAVLPTARAWAAAAVSGLHAGSHTETKLRARAGVLAELRAGLAELDGLPG